VTAAGVFAGIAGLGLGIAAGTVWELIHRHRRRGRTDESLAAEARSPAIVETVAVVETQAPEQPRLQLVSSAGPRGGSSGTRAAGQSRERSSSPAGRARELGGIIRLPAAAPGLRDLVLAIIVIGTVGLIAELLLLEHIESWQQLIPLGVLAAGLIASATVRLRPRPSTVTGFRIVMGGFVASGLLGLYFHYAGNVEFALERTPELSGLALVWKAMRGATPTLAPGALAQLGLLGLVYAYRHPATEFNRPDPGPTEK
jgi:hypothetical protein